MNRFSWPSCLAIAIALSHVAATAGDIQTVAGTGQPSNNGNAGVATQINVGDPFGVEIGPDDALYITEVRNHRVLRLDRKTGQLTTVAGTGVKGYRGDGGLATEAELNEPYEVRFDHDGNMYFVEMQNHLIRRIDAKTGKIETIAGTGKQGFSGDGGPATQAMFSRPHSIALDHRGGLYVADIGNHRIRRIDLKAGTVDTFVGNGKKHLPQAGKVDSASPMIGPRALFIQGDTMWVALREGHSLWRLDLSSQTLTHVAGTGKGGFSGDGGDPLKATFNGPKGVAVDPDGNVVVVDTENQTIRKVDLKNNVITTIAGQGPKHRGAAGDGGSATAAELNRPHGICVDAEGVVYIGDTINHRVRAFGK